MVNLTFDSRQGETLNWLKGDAGVAARSCWSLGSSSLGHFVVDRCSASWQQPGSLAQPSCDGMDGPDNGGACRRPPNLFRHFSSS
jgi:hypothetical protein